MQYIRINKSAARKLYNAGKEFLIIPCKCRPGGAWLTGFTVNSNNSAVSFDSYINEFTYYNCNNELGKYPAFYKEV